MKHQNNFEELENETIDKYGEPPSEIAHNVKSNMRLFHFLGNLIDLYFPKVIKIFTNMASDNEIHSQNGRKPEDQPPNLSNKNQ